MMLSGFVVGLLTAWPGFIITLILLLSWLIAGLPILCISPSRYSMVATCLALIACMFGAGLGPWYLALATGIIALVVWVIIFAIGELVALITALPRVWWAWPHRLLLGGLRLVMA